MSYTIAPVAIPRPRVVNSESGRGFIYLNARLAQVSHFAQTQEADRYLVAPQRECESDAMPFTVRLKPTYRPMRHMLTSVQNDLHFKELAPRPVREEDRLPPPPIFVQMPKLHHIRAVHPTKVWYDNVARFEDAVRAPVARNQRPRSGPVEVSVGYIAPEHAWPASVPTLSTAPRMIPLQHAPTQTFECPPMARTRSDPGPPPHNGALPPLGQFPRRRNTEKLNAPSKHVPKVVVPYPGAGFGVPMQRARSDPGPAESTPSRFGIRPFARPIGPRVGC